jgi:NitT/TauT family transport system ATP-binding protein
VSFAGAPLAGPTSQISMIFQDAVMLPWFTVLENVALPERIARRNLDAARDRARGLLQSVGLGGFEDSYPEKLSGGMRQRAAIVRALMTNPRMLLMDEPFGALDAMTRENMNLQLSEITAASGCGVLLITHSIAEAVLLADRVVVMTPRPGRIADDIAITIPRPRSRASMTHPDFVDLCDRLRSYFVGDGHGLD